MVGPRNGAYVINVRMLKGGWGVCACEVTYHGEYRNGEAPLGGAKHVGDDAASVGERGGTEGACEEAEDDECVNIRGTGSAALNAVRAP